MCGHAPQNPQSVAIHVPLPPLEAPLTASPDPPACVSVHGRAGACTAGRARACRSVHLRAGASVHSRTPPCTPVQGRTRGRRAPPYIPVQGRASPCKGGEQGRAPPYTSVHPRTREDRARACIPVHGRASPCRGVHPRARESRAGACTSVHDRAPPCRGVQGGASRGVHARTSPYIPAQGRARLHRGQDPTPPRAFNPALEGGSNPFESGPWRFGASRAAALRLPLPGRGPGCAGEGSLLNAPAPGVQSFKRPFKGAFEDSNRRSTPP
ncbi:hypothetical protein TtJL18_2345 (plasmid) [Thermus thermophilus JL-18]|uniref:Uncharacterized protein n=1 Tax=Thermus thermophilus JL-18 TaxID=798128 RepID=H9ZV14_THETH|nr:hypothetical protein TtJL18_2345 [Thermus thermophilus JL-18]